MIPDSEHRVPVRNPPFRDADGCARFPGGHQWIGWPEFRGVDGYTSHVPFTLGVVGQFEMAWDCHAQETLNERHFEEDAEDEDVLTALLEDPLVRELAQEVLDGLPDVEIAFEEAPA